ncbi:site-specific integrase [Microbispora sp. NPDC046933]|uniref:tyrosine-type recombinase/integrase n=1 Tax=Microbispora sp. NPDC046933 TaxID=3155618 RepID=UPI0033E3EF95
MPSRAVDPSLNSSAFPAEITPRNVAKLVKVSPPKYYKVNRGLTVPQARALLKAAQGHRLGALYVLAVCLGLRRRELLGLRWEDVDLEAGTLEVVQTSSGSAADFFPFRRGTLMEPDKLRRSWSEIRKAAGLGTVRLHDLRHTCVSLLLDRGVPPHIVREIVGHSDIEVTMTIYAHSSLDDKRALLDKLDDALG